MKKRTGFDMREDICSIPVSEVFAPKDGCPICRMVSTLEEHLVEYITGAAMMEPDVRQETNRTGFCPEHFRMMLARRNRLSVALTLESHLKELQKNFDFGGKAPSKNQLAALQLAADGCFVCDKVEWGLQRLITEVFVLWQREEEFRRLFSEQSGLCLPHAVRLLSQAQKEMHRKAYPAFAAAVAAVAKKQLDVVSADVSGYCKMYDYRNAGGDWGNTKDSIERSMLFLTGEPAAPGGQS